VIIFPEPVDIVCTMWYT